MRFTGVAMGVKNAAAPTTVSAIMRRTEGPALPRPTTAMGSTTRTVAVSSEHEREQAQREQREVRIHRADHVEQPDTPTPSRPRPRASRQRVQ